MTADQNLCHPDTPGRPTIRRVASHLPRLRWYLGRLSAMSPRELLHRVQHAARQRLWRSRYRGWSAFMTVGDGPLSDFPGLRARLARVPILDEGYPAAESLKQVRDGCLSF